MESQTAQFIALYGRRRVGKTYLIKRFFDNKFDFYMSGVYQLPMNEQLGIFADQLKLYFKRNFQKPRTWLEAFNMLRDELKRLRKRTWVVFLDDKTKSPETIHLTLITTKGLKDSRYSGNINSSVTLDDLFKD